MPVAGDNKYLRPFHAYTLGEFERAPDASGTQFFGFRASPRSLFSNITLLMVACVLVYYGGRHHPLIRATYGSAPLTTVALVFGFVLANEGAPFLLKLAVYGLSRLKAEDDVLPAAGHPSVRSEEKAVRSPQETAAPAERQPTGAVGAS